MVLRTVTDSEPTSHASQAYVEVLRRIRRGLLLPGDKIVDTALAVEMETSRMPAREALLRLVHEGYLVKTARGFMLPRLSEQDVNEIFEVRKMLEPRAAATACLALTEFDLAWMDTAFKHAREAVEAEDGAGLMEANTTFRDIWLKAVPNQRLAMTLTRFVDHVHAVRAATLHDRATRSMSLSLLSSLVDGFHRRDTLYVHDQMLSFVSHAQEQFFALRTSTSESGPERQRRSRRKTKSE